MSDECCFYRKYRNRPDIKILVCEKSIDSLESEQATHDISGLAYFLKGYGFSVDLVWTLGRYKFENFEDFCRNIRTKLQIKIDESLRPEDKQLEEILLQDGRKRLGEFEDAYRLLRREPINSVSDLAPYDFFVFHPNSDDCSGTLLALVEAYPQKPVILPYGSVSAAGVQDRIRFAKKRAPRMPFDEVEKDPEREIYLLREENPEDTALNLIEFLLDRDKR